MFKQIKKHLPCFPDIGIVADSNRNINPMIRTSRIVCDRAICERSVRQNNDTLIRRYNLRIENVHLLNNSVISLFIHNPVVRLMILLQFLCNFGMTGIGPILPLYI